MAASGMPRMPAIGEQPRAEVRLNRGAGVTEPWTFEEDKAFEMALVANWMQPDRVAKCRPAVPNKSLDALMHRYALLQADVASIARGSVRLPLYGASVTPSPLPVAKGKKGGGEERRKGVPWTEEEHRLFVAGLAEFGKGDWRSISRNFVLTRTPTQVASHAQKYFIRMNSGKKNDKRRSSIHDITTPSGAAAARNGSAGGPSKSAQGGRGPLQGGVARALPPRPAAPISQPPRPPRPTAVSARPQQQRPLQGGQLRPVGALRTAGLQARPRPQQQRQPATRPPTLERLPQAGARLPVPHLPPGAVRPPGGSPVGTSAGPGRAAPPATRPPQSVAAAAPPQVPTTATAAATEPPPLAQDKI